MKAQRIDLQLARIRAQEKLRDILDGRAPVNQLELNDLLGRQCPCSGCHQEEWRLVRDHVDRKGLDYIAGEISNDILAMGKVSTSHLLALETLATWLQGRQTEGRPAALPSASLIDERVEILGEPDASLVKHYLKKNFRHVRFPDEYVINSYVAALMRTTRHIDAADRLQDLSRIGTSDIRGIDSELKYIVEKKVPQTKRVVLPVTAPFDEKWRTLRTRDHWRLIRFYFHPVNEREKLLTEIPRLESNLKRIVLEEILRGHRNWTKLHYALVSTKSTASEPEA